MKGERNVGGVPGAIGVWVLNAMLAVASMALFMGVVMRLPGPSGDLRIGWSLLAVAFAASEILVVHIQFKRNAYSFSFSEIPLVVGLFFVAPRGLVLAQLLGVAAVLALYRRQSALKLVFNLATATLQASLAIAVVSLVAGEAPVIGPLSALGAMLGTMVGVLVADLAIGLAISLAEGESHSRTSFRMLGVSLAGVATNTGVALIMVQILWTAPWAAFLLAVPMVALFAAYGAYTSQREQRESLEFLYDAMRILDKREVESAIVDLLGHVREMFRAELAEIVLFPVMVGDHAFRTTLGPDDRLEVLQAVDLESFDAAWRPLISRRQPLLMARGTGEAADLPTRMRDALFTTLEGETRVIGTLLVANRLGDVSTFDREDLRLFETLASHTSIAIENGRLEKTLAELSAVERERARLLDRVVQAAEDERTRLSGELHDGPVQRLSAIAMALDRMRVRLGRSDLDGVMELLGPTQEWLSNEVYNLRQLMAELRPPVLDERGLAAALEGYAMEFQELTGIRATADMQLTGRLGPANETVLYRVAQEALTNVRKHAQARSVSIALGRVGDSVVLEVRDDGVGFDPGENGRRIDSRNHIGLSVMRERMEMAGGRWEVFSQAGGGTTILATLPHEAVDGGSAQVDEVEYVRI